MRKLSDHNCRIIGGGAGSGSGNGDGLHHHPSAQLRLSLQTVMERCSHDPNSKTTIVSNCTIVNNGGDGIDTDMDSGTALTPNGEANIIFGNGGVDLRADASDDRQQVFNFLQWAITLVETLLIGFIRRYD